MIFSTVKNDCIISATTKEGITLKTACGDMKTLDRYVDVLRNDGWENIRTFMKPTKILDTYFCPRCEATIVSNSRCWNCKQEIIWTDYEDKKGMWQSAKRVVENLRKRILFQR